MSAGNKIILNVSCRWQLADTHTFSFDPIQNKMGAIIIFATSHWYTLCVRNYSFFLNQIWTIYIHFGGYRTIVIVEVFEHFVFYFWCYNMVVYLSHSLVNWYPPSTINTYNIFNGSKERMNERKEENEAYGLNITTFVIICRCQQHHSTLIL